jgi:hypothetical protein
MTISVTLLFLRLKQTRPWRSFLYFNMAIAMTVSAAVVQRAEQQSASRASTITHVSDNDLTKFNYC